MIQTRHQQIQRIIRALEALWLATPSQRLGQLLTNVLADGDTNDSGTIYHTSDAMVESLIQLYAEQQVKTLRTE